MLIELFSLGVTAEALRANIGSKSAISFQLGPVDPKFELSEQTIDCGLLFNTLPLNSDYKI